MGVISRGVIKDFDLLKSFILSLPKVHDNPLQNLIYNIARSSVKNNDIIITRGIHYGMDTAGNYHFNFTIMNKGSPGMEHHAYVVPMAVFTPTGGIVHHPNNDVDLGCIQHYIWQFHHYT